MTPLDPIRQWGTATYRPCSGQSKGRRQWGICRQDNNPPWWRAQDAAGRPRLFASHEAAMRACRKLEESK